ncbi:MAG: DUF881 domain-containing protein [Candidatus Sericytochromatia bacterium]|nr:DUF881 domain-containing protein [Candidatus Sericytochromatia bacterium]
MLGNSQEQLREAAALLTVEPNHDRPSYKIPLAIICGLIGLLVTLQIKSLAFKATEAFPPSRREEDIANLIKASDSKQLELTAALEVLKEQIAARLDPTRAQRPSLAGGQEAWQAQAVAGTLALKGEGVVLTVDDSHVPVGKGENPNNAIVHNEDLLRLTNLLTAAGAEALAINEQRLAATTEITCAGPTILINKTRMAPPFSITAIGDSAMMMAAINMPGGVVESLRSYGLELKAETASALKIPALGSNPNFKFAKTQTPKMVKPFKPATSPAASPR